MEILLVVPFYRGDQGQVERLGKWMTTLSKRKKIGDKILFSATVNATVNGIGDNFKGLFTEMKAIQQTFGPNLEYNENPWPKACNLQFLHTIKHIYENYPDIDAFYYFEPDNLPLTPDWFDRIKADYEKQGKPFYGVSSSYVERIDGADAFLDGEHMIGTGIYPRDAWKRIKAYEKMEQVQSNRPFDAITRDEINPQCHFTNLISHAHQSRGFIEDQFAGLNPRFNPDQKDVLKIQNATLTAVYRPNLEKEMIRRPVVIPKEAVVFHGCKDASLRLIMAKRRDLPQKDVLTFGHAGDFGDVIYALPAIEARGGGILKLFPKLYTREVMTPARADVIAPLLFEQPYIKGVEIGDGEYVDFDLCQFRAMRKLHSNLVEDQANWIGATVDLSKPWLTVPEAKPSGHILINRTERYHNELFPWPIIHRSLLDHLRFIGLEEEHEQFEFLFGSATYLPTKNLLDVALAIKGSHTFIGNQSCCFAIAEGLKHPRIQETYLESQDCLFEGDAKAQYCPNGKILIPALESRSSDMDLMLTNPLFLKCVRKLVRDIIEEELK